MVKHKTKSSQNLKPVVPSVSEEKLPVKSKITLLLGKIKLALFKSYGSILSWVIIGAWVFFCLLVFFSLNYWSNVLKIVKIEIYNFPVLENVTKEIKCDFAHPITGVCLKNKEEEKYTDEVLAAGKVFTVMVENHTAARPQSGLSQADVVYEALVEGGFTRFMAVYDSLQEVKAIGPVRSARDYYLWWAKEYNNPLYAHVGGSPKALSLIASQGMIDCDEFYHGDIFERVSWRSAPHNTYVSVADLGLCRPTMKDAGLFNDIQSWKYTNEEIDSENPVTNLQISYSQNTNYDVEWQYNEEEGLYYRFNAGQPHLDKNSNQQITAKNVIVMEVLNKVVDDIGRLEMNNIGSGPVLIYNQGKRQRGQWKKESYSDRTIFVDANGEELWLVPGNTWIQVVPNNYQAITEK